MRQVFRDRDSEGPVMTGVSLTGRMETSSELSAVLAPPAPTLPKSSVRKEMVEVPSKVGWRIVGKAIKCRVDGCCRPCELHTGHLNHRLW